MYHISMKIIAVCTCSGMKEKAESAYKILFPGEEMPKIYKGDSAIRLLAEKNPNTNLSRYLLAIAKKHGQFAYFIDYDDNGDITVNYDLKTGKRLA